MPSRINRTPKSGATIDARRRRTGAPAVAGAPRCPLAQGPTALNSAPSAFFTTGRVMPKHAASLVTTWTVALD